MKRHKRRRSFSGAVSGCALLCTYFATVSGSFPIAAAQQMPRLDELPQAKVVKQLDDFPGASSFSLGHVSHDGKTLLAAPLVENQKYYLFAWNLDDSKVTQKFEWRQHDGIADESIAAEKNVIAVGFISGSIVCWDWESNKTVTVKAHENLLTNVALNPAARLVASTDIREKKILLHRVSSSQSGSKTIDQYADQCVDLSFSDDGRYFLGIEHPGTLKLTDTKTGEHLWQQTFSNGRSNAHFRPQTDEIVLVFSEGVILGCDVNTGARQWNMSGVAVSFPLVTAVSRDGRYLAVSAVEKESAKNRVVIWDLEKRQAISRYECAEKQANRIDFFPDGKSLIVFQKKPVILEID